VFEDRPTPQLKDGHDVLVHVSQTGICGSDVRNNLSLHNFIFEKVLTAAIQVH
jgi:threonine dehydrogenase-like Zn-dependent dehydrogenase